MTQTGTVMRGAARPAPDAPPSRPQRTQRSCLARSFLREVGYVTVLLVLYNVGRLLAATRVNGAYDNAKDLLSAERFLHLPHEQSLQAFVLARPDLAQVANRYYAFVHFPLTMLVLAWLFLCRPTHYVWARRALVLATGTGLMIMVLLPTAPPRMLHAQGFVDTGLAFGQSVYGTVGQDRLANQFAAMPSLHVGWALLVAVLCISASRTRWRWLWVAHPVVTLLVVVVTGNHFWLDAFVGAGLVTASLVLTRGALSDHSESRNLLLGAGHLSLVSRPPRVLQPGA